MDDLVFKALGDPSRRRLLDRLNLRNGQSLRELCAGLQMARQSVSKHLALLEAANLVTTRRRGREKLHFLNAEPINAIAERWINRYDRPRAEAIAALRDALELPAATDARGGSAGVTHREGQQPSSAAADASQEHGAGETPQQHPGTADDAASQEHPASADHAASQEHPASADHAASQEHPASADHAASQEHPVMSTSFLYTTYIKTSPEQLWTALTDPAFTRRYWGVALISDWQVGSSVTWELPRDVTITDPAQVVLASDPPHKLSYTWHTISPEFLVAYPDQEELMARAAAEQRSRVTFEIEPMGEMVKLTVMHDDFEPGSVILEGVSQGWPAIIAGLKTLLETGEPLTAAVA